MMTNHLNGFTADVTEVPGEFIAPPQKARMMREDAKRIDNESRQFEARIEGEFIGPPEGMREERDADEEVREGVLAALLLFS